MSKHHPPARATKTELIRRALSCKSGSSIADLSATTDWQVHSVRAALSRFRKAGYLIERTAPKKGAGSPVYRIIRAPVAS